MTQLHADRGCSRAARVWAVALLAVAAGAGTVASAFPATLTVAAHLRAGPSVEYPVVSMVPPGAPLEIVGCEAGFDWCDVQFGPQRGWMDAWYLQGNGPAGPTIIGGNGVVLGIAVTSFVFANYWNTYYIGRPWYRQRNHYFQYWNRYPHGRPPPRPRPPMVRPPPRPPGHGMRPPPGGGVRPPPGGGVRPPPGGGVRPPPGGGGVRPPPGGGNRPPPGGGNRPGPGGSRPSPGNGSGAGAGNRPQPRPAPGN